MKIKIDFVTNSSSASFTIPLDKITEQQKIMIYNHMDVAKSAMRPDIFEYNSKRSGWDITEVNGKISGFTLMDNFDMHTLLVEVIKIPEDILDYEDNH